MGAKGTDKQNAATGQEWGSQYNQEGQDTLGAVSPFLKNEMTDPTGLGPQTVAEMKTQGGQIASGGVGAATEAANLRASRTGNTAATSGIIDAAARAGMGTESGVASGVDIENAKLKEQQRQAGAGGLESLYGKETANALSSLGLSNQAAANEQTAQQGNFSDVMSVANAVASPGPLAAFGI